MLGRARPSARVPGRRCPPPPSQAAFSRLEVGSRPCAGCRRIYRRGCRRDPAGSRVLRGAAAPALAPGGGRFWGPAGRSEPRYSAEKGGFSPGVLTSGQAEGGLALPAAERPPLGRGRGVLTPCSGLGAEHRAGGPRKWKCLSGERSPNPRLGRYSLVDGGSGVAAAPERLPGEGRQENNSAPGAGPGGRAGGLGSAAGGGPRSRSPLASHEKQPPLGRFPTQKPQISGGCRRAVARALPVPLPREGSQPPLCETPRPGSPRRPRAPSPSPPPARTLPFARGETQGNPQGPALAPHATVSAQSRAPVAGRADVAVPGAGKAEDSRRRRGAGRLPSRSRAELGSPSARGSSPG